MEPGKSRAKSHMSENCIVAVHAGAGYHGVDKEHEYRSVCAMACKKAMAGLKTGLSALNAVVLAVKYLEDANCTNAGMGSSLNMQGQVECDASVMDGQSLNFGAVGAVSGLKNPVAVAKKLVDEQKQGKMSLGRVPPCIMVGSGARKWASEHGIPTVVPESLISDSAMKAYKNNKRKLSIVEERMQRKRKHLVQDDHLTAKNGKITRNGVQDTVGAVCIDSAGNLAAGVSSGGISLKQPGRLGSACTYGSGCWAWNWQSESKPGVAVATSGTGEHLMKTLLARECAECLQLEDFTENAFKTALQDKFLGSDILPSASKKFGALLALKLVKSAANIGQCELMWGHTTDSMCIGYMSSGSKAKVLIGLRFLAKGAFYSELADLHGVSKSSVCLIIDSFLDAVNNKLDNIRFPVEEVSNIKLNFYKRCGLPKVVGAVDGTLVPIQAPAEDEATYVCRKGFHAVNMQAVVDSNMRFLDIVARWPGSQHNAFIFENSGIKTYLERSNIGYLLGDSGYPLRHYLMTPILSPTTHAEEEYNSRHAQGRMVVEKAFGVLKSRFRKEVPSQVRRDSAIQAKKML